MPYATAAEARAARVWLDRFFSTVFRAWFGSETRDLWLDYLYGRAGTSRRVISGASSEIVQGFQDSDTIEDYQEDLLDDVVSAMASSCPTVPPNTWTAIPVATVMHSFNPDPQLNFDHITEIPGNIAGGISGSAFGTDSRHVSGNIRFFRRTDSIGNTISVQIETDLDFIVRDAIDFCPGGAGAGIEQQVAVPLSRLEAKGWAYTVGKDVVFGAGQYAPGTSGGRRLMAHELTHVVQQADAGSLLQRQPSSTRVESETKAEEGEEEATKVVTDGAKLVWDKLKTYNPKFKKLTLDKVEDFAERKWDELPTADKVVLGGVGCWHAGYAGCGSLE